MTRRVAAALLLVCAASMPAMAQDDPATLAREAMTRLDLAAERLAAAEAGGGPARVAALTAAIRAHEDGLAALRAGLRAAAAQQRAREQDFAARSGEVSRLLGVLAAIGREQEAQALVHPGGPIGTVRAAMMVGAVTPALQAEARALRAELDTLAATRLLQEAAVDRLGAGLADLQGARADLAQAMADRRPLPAGFGADPTRLAGLLAASDTLAAFADGLAALPGRASPARATPQPEALPLPVAGRVLRRFGEADPQGASRPGLTLATLPGALVTAPVTATVLYSGPLLDYGNVMVLEPSVGFMLVLAGLGDTYAEAGEIVAAGAPLGLAGGSAPLPTQPDGYRTGIMRSETLYIEVRQDRRPVDPAAWFAMDRQE